MGRKFNVTGTCTQEEDYMVDITDKLVEIKKKVDAREYFTINRGRQYGKTTTLHYLENYLSREYIVISLSFEGMGSTVFQSEEAFCPAFLKKVQKALRFANVDKGFVKKWENDAVKSFDDLSEHLTDLCEGRKIVLMIDEVDKASNHVVFLDFLGKLREKYLARKVGKDYTFHSVILAGVYDIKNIKLKMIKEGHHVPSETESTTNSPWNIASSFSVDMSFKASEIAGMLNDYKREKQVEMDVETIAGEIYHYTSGYPVLVSAICKIIDEELDQIWTTANIRRAVKRILKADTVLFKHLTKNLNSNEELSALLYNVVMTGKKYAFSIHNELIYLCHQYGYVKESTNGLKVANLIFEAFLTAYFTSRAEINESIKKQLTISDTSGIIDNNQLNMDLCLEKFSKHLQKNYNTKDEQFIEREGRLLFLTFLSPILNGQGFAYIEAQSPDGKRTDVIVNYLNEQYIIELKIWDGMKKHEDAKTQLLGYMKRFEKNEGYLLTFDFRAKKILTHEWIQIDDKRKILNVIV